VKNKNHATTDDEYYVVPVIPVDEAIHTPERPFCDEMECPCHEDQSNIDQLGEYYQDGLVSTGDADRIYRGKML
jgi:hypothetical protein